MSGFMKEHFEGYAEDGESHVYFSEGMHIVKSVDDYGKASYGMVSEEQLRSPDWKPPDYEKRFKDLKEHYDKNLELHNRETELQTLKIELDSIEELLKEFNKEKR
tara:strand:- start:42 stop:356 length:315 start_codon:yes stop_codon:yes gene_type:complete